MALPPIPLPCDLPPGWKQQSGCDCDRLRADLRAANEMIGRLRDRLHEIEQAAVAGLANRNVAPCRR